MTIRTITVPVKDLQAATKLYTALLGTGPYIDQAYYVGFRPEDAPEVGLDPHGDVTAGPITYYHVDDIEASIAELTDLGATTERSPRDVGGGSLTATVRDADGNLIGLFQAPGE
ncbi:VOC family protein [Actinoplanes sp. NPDC051411]|uniref:VOC family protein n=1 Tax=Actinoplanes sp. NPDC051411 TaxID=3155522 RepID=UPI00341DC406